MDRSPAQLHGPPNAFDDAGVHEGRHPRTESSRGFRRADGRIPVDLRTGVALRRPRGRPREPQVARHRQPLRVVGRHAGHGFRHQLRPTVLPAWDHGRERSPLHPLGPVAPGRLARRQEPLTGHRHSHDGYLRGPGRRRLRGRGGRHALVEDHLPLVRYHRNSLLSGADSPAA